MKNAELEAFEFHHHDVSNFVHITGELDYILHFASPASPIDYLEIPIQTIEELLVNALIHRDYFILSSIKVLIFDNRIEIISPGILPNTLTIDNIKIGTSIPRNPILFTNARYILPFVGVGSGIPRAIENSPDLELINDVDREVFISIIKRTE